MNATEFMRERKQLVIEMRELVYDRSLINKQVRHLQKELNGLDTYLVNRK